MDDDDEEEEEAAEPTRAEMMDKEQFPWPSLKKYAEKVLGEVPSNNRRELVAAIIEERE